MMGVLKVGLLLQLRVQFVQGAGVRRQVPEMQLLLAPLHRTVHDGADGGVPALAALATRRPGQCQKQEDHVEGAGHMGEEKEGAGTGDAEGYRVSREVGVPVQHQHLINIFK